MYNLFQYEVSWGLIEKNTIDRLSFREETVSTQFYTHCLLLTFMIQRLRVYSLLTCLLYFAKPIHDFRVVHALIKHTGASRLFGIFTLFQAVCPQISSASAFWSYQLNTHMWLNPGNLRAEPLPPICDSFQTESNLFAKASTSLHVKNKPCRCFRPQHYRTMHRVNNDHVPQSK